jgi:hypothetical protein
MEPEDYGLIPLAQCIADADAERCRRIRAALPHRATGKLCTSLRTAFWSGQRVASFLLAEELTARGVPPSLREMELDRLHLGLNEKFDLFIYDAHWIMRRYPDQVTAVRFVQTERLFKESTFHQAAQFTFYYGQRPPGKIAGGLALTAEQQWECSWLRSKRITKSADAIASARPSVRKKLRETIYAARNKAFSNDDAAASLLRRERLWLCSQMFGDSPTEISRRYEQMTGERIARNVVAKQLQTITNALR